MQERSEEILSYREQFFRAFNGDIAKGTWLRSWINLGPIESEWLSLEQLLRADDSRALDDTLGKYQESFSMLVLAFCGPSTKREHADESGLAYVEKDSIADSVRPLTSSKLRHSECQALASALLWITFGQESEAFKIHVSSRGLIPGKIAQTLFSGARRQGENIHKLRSRLRELQNSVVYPRCSLTSVEQMMAISRNDGCSVSPFAYELIDFLKRNDPK
jgi:hypothetical protein